jgi:predicted transcriptional regulator
MGNSGHNNMMDKEKIAEHLQRFVAEHEMTQEELARLISAPLSSLSSWILGKRQMSKVWQKVLQDKKILPPEDEKKERRF